MAQKLTAAMPSDLDLEKGWQVRLTAIDPSSGANVTTVVVSNVAIIASVGVPPAAQDDTGNQLVLPPPLLVPISEEDEG